MLIDYSLQMALSDLHRTELLADAEAYRTARLASSARRRWWRARRSPGDPPETPAADRGPAASANPAVAAGPGSADSNSDAERRYAVPR